MAHDLDQHTTAKQDLNDLARAVARMSARVSCEMGVEFDVADPRVARWLILATFEGMCMRSAQSTTEELLAIAEQASAGEERMPSCSRKKGDKKLLRVTWEDLVASQAASPSDSSPK